MERKTPKLMSLLVMQSSSSNISSMVSLNTPKFSTSIVAPPPPLLQSAIKPANTSEFAPRTSESTSITMLPPFFPRSFSFTSSPAAACAAGCGGEDWVRKLWDRSCDTAGVGSESMGETLPGDKIRRGSIRPTMGNPDLVLWGELGTETLRLGKGCALWGDLEIEVSSGLDGGIANEQQHARRRGFRRDHGFIGPLTGCRKREWERVRES